MRTLFSFALGSLLFSAIYACGTAKEDTASKKELRATQDNYDGLSIRFKHNSQYLEASELFHQQNTEIMSLVLNITTKFKTLQNLKANQENFDELSTKASSSFDLSRNYFEKAEQTEKTFNFKSNLDNESGAIIDQAVKAREVLSNQLDLLSVASEKFNQEDNQELKAQATMLNQKIAEFKESSSSLLCAALSGQCKK